MRKALIVWGGWDGHEPDKVANICSDVLKENGFETVVSDTLESLNDGDALLGLDLIVPVWTMGEISNDQVKAVSNAVSNGVGIGGCHGGMCDSFRASTEWQFITGGNWVSHPGGDGVEYTVNVKGGPGTLLEGISDFQVSTEHYYLHIDPAIKIHATTRFPLMTWFHSPNGDVDMPVVWTKRWGAGRVFYTSLGHHADVFDVPEAREILKRGLLWAAEGKAVAAAEGISAETYKSEAKMF